MIEKILERLDGVRKSGKGYIAKCSAHDDKTPSLSVTELPDGRILMKCFAGCPTHDVLTAIGLEMGDLFPDGCLGEFRGFQQIEEDINNRKKAKGSLDETILAMAKSDRAAGKRLSPRDLEIERQAYMRVRHASIGR